jgi:hypothetical protein
MTEPGHYHEVLKDLSTQHRALRQDIPEVYKAFNELGNAALTDGALSTKVKELVERYEEVKVPSMKFAMYRDQWTAGQKKTAAACCAFCKAQVAKSVNCRDRWNSQSPTATAAHGNARRRR